MSEGIGLHLCDDLIFSSRVEGTARSLGLKVRAVKTAGELMQGARQVLPCCVILDLQVAGFELEEMVRELTALEPRPFLVSYGSHVDTATLKRAREAGCDVVWPRSKFVEELATALPTWFRHE